MSKRRGDVVFLDEFVDEIGVDAARWYLLSRGHDQAIEIDVDLAAERSQKNPVYYVQYAHARIAGILRNAEGRRPTRAPARALAPEERDLVKRLLELPEVVREATARRGAARDPDLRDPRRRRLPPLLPPPPRARGAGGGVPPRALRGDARRRRHVPRPDRRRRARAHVARSERSYDRAMRWNLALGALAASWGFIAVLVAAVDLGAEALAFWRLALAARRSRSSRSRATAGRLARAGASARSPARHRAGRPLAPLLRGRQARLRRARGADVLRGAAPDRASSRRSSSPSGSSAVVLGAASSAPSGSRDRPRRGGDGASSAAAVAAGLGRRATYAVLVLLSKRLLSRRRRRSPSPSGTAWSGAMAVAPVLLLADRVLPDGASEWAAVLALGVVFTGVSTLIYAPLLRHVAAQAAGVLTFLEPVAGVLLAWALLEQRPGAATLVGGALVVAAGVAVVLLEPTEAPRGGRPGRGRIGPE